MRFGFFAVPLGERFQIPQRSNPARIVEFGERRVLERVEQDDLPLRLLHEAEEQVYLLPFGAGRRVVA